MRSDPGRGQLRRHDSIKSDGKITIATDAAYAPNEFTLEAWTSTSARRPARSSASRSSSSTPLSTASRQAATTAACRRSPTPRSASTPVLVQVIFWSFIAILYPVLSLGIPFGPEFVYFDSNLLIPIFAGAVLGFGLNEAAYPRCGAGAQGRVLRDGSSGNGAGMTAQDVTPMVKFEGVHKYFGRLEVLKGIDLEVMPGEVMCVIGPSGSGKLTFLRCINHLEKLTAGKLWGDGELVGYRQKGDKLYELEVAAKRREIGLADKAKGVSPRRGSG